MLLSLTFFPLQLINSTFVSRKVEVVLLVFTGNAEGISEWFIK